jgi:hypothetical protein
MADVIQDAQQEFWQSPTAVQPVLTAVEPIASLAMADACADCGSEFMIHARFCHTCGCARPLLSSANLTVANSWTRGLTWIGSTVDSAAIVWRRISFPAWLQYLHFHQIQRWIGLPTASLISFMIGLGCIAGSLGVSFFYKASNLAEFQAIQMWRIEWLLAATASFVAGILLKRPSSKGHDND